MFRLFCGSKKAALGAGLLLVSAGCWIKTYYDYMNNVDSQKLSLDCFASSMSAFAGAMLIADELMNGSIISSRQSYEIQKGEPTPPNHPHFE